jgi:CBS domain containing-hemolysin-like protein
LNTCPPALLAGAPPSNLIQSDLEAVLWTLAALLLTAAFATLRRALAHSHPDRILDRARNEDHRRRLEPLLGRADSLATSASLFKITFELAFIALVLDLTSGEAPLTWPHFALTLAITAPSLLLLAEGLPAALARRFGDDLLLRTLGPFHVFQWPLAGPVALLDGLRRTLLRVLGLPVATDSARRIVEGLREVIEENADASELDETEREFLENVMEFRDVDVAAIMTPRTEIHGVNVESNLRDAVILAANSGHSRIPVFEDSPDSIIGTIEARDILQILARDAFATTTLRDILHPAFFTPETRHLSDLVDDFRREKVKMAIVLDEYGGTAGLVTLGDVVSEVFGEIADDFDEEEPAALRILADGMAEVMGNLRVAEVNEALDLAIPEEEDFETLAGYVLSELGHFPKPGESFTRGDVTYSILEANDRRVLRVAIRTGPARASA